MVPPADDRADEIGDPCSPFLTSDEAARYLRFPEGPKQAEFFRQWARREHLQPRKRGRVLLWDKQYLDNAITPKAHPAKRGAR